MQPRTYKRRQYIVDPDFQYTFIKRIFIFCILMILMSISFLCLVDVLYGDIQFQLFQPDPFDFSENVDTLSGQTTILNLIWPVLGVCLGAALVVTFFFGVLLSHRMAGPIFRIRRILSEMAEGDLRGEVRLRKKDDFKSLAESINGVKKSWRKHIARMQQICAAAASDDGTRKNQHIKALQDILNGFQY